MKGELPEGWAETTLGQIAEINPRHPQDVSDRTTVTFVRMAGVSASQPNFEATEVRPLGEVRKGFTHFADGDVLFAKITPCMENGKGAVARRLKNGLGCGTTELHVIRPGRGIDSDYVYRYLSQAAVRQAAAEHFTSTAGQARVPTSFIEELELPVPPEAEQRRITRQIQVLAERLSLSQKRLANIAVVLQRLRQSILAAACSGRLTSDWRETQGLKDDDNPAGWEQVCISDVIESLKYGTSKKCDYAKRGVPVLRIPNVANGRIDHGDIKYAVLPAAELKQLRLEPGDVLVIRSNGSVSLVGRSALVGEAERGFAYAGYLIRLRPLSPLVVPQFLNLVLGSYDVRLQIELEARSTSGVNNINSDELRALVFSLPPRAEQNEILRRVNALSKLADRIKAEFETAQAKIDKLTPALLAKAFRGELVPTEAELAEKEGRDYESGDVLLNRIRQMVVLKNSTGRPTTLPRQGLAGRMPKNEETGKVARQRSSMRRRNVAR